MKILFVDDEPAVLEQGKIFLKKEKECLNVETAVSAKEALEMFEEEDYDAIVSDYQMPGANGLEFLEEVREERDSDIPFIIFTGKGREEVAMETLNLGGNRYLQKGGDPRSQYGILADAIVQEVEHSRVEERRNFFRISATHAPEAIFVSDRNGETVYVNEQASENLGYSIEELEEMDVFDRNPNMTPEQWDEHWENVRERGKYKVESVHERKDGMKFPVELLINHVEFGGRDYHFTYSRDITERKKMEEELQESERKFRKSFKASPDPVFLLDEDGVFVDVNETALQILGFEEEEIVGSSLWDAPFFPDETVEKTTERFKRRKEGEEIPSYSVELETKDGDRIITEVNVGKFEEDGFEGEIVIARDITERKEKEEEIQRERKRFREIFNNANDAIYLHELTEEGMPGEFIEVNDVACEMLGYSKEEFWEMTPQDIDSSKKADEVPGVMEELLEEGDVRFEMPHQAKDGTEIPVEIHSHLFELGGEKRVLSIARGISGKKEREEKYRVISEGSSNGIYVFQDGKFKFVNEPLVEMFGYSREELKDINFLELVHPDYRARVEGWTKQALTGDTSDLPESPDLKVLTELKVLRKDGSSFWALFTLTHVEYQGKPAIIGNVLDITERRKTKERLEKIKERYEELFHGSNDLVVTTDPEGYIKRVNQKTIEHWGYSEEELVGESILKIAHPESVEKQIEMWKEILEKKEEVNNTVRNVTKDGEVRWLRVGGRPILEDGEIVEIQYNAQDITELVKTRRREEFLHSLLRHDVRNKAQVVQGYLEVLEDTGLSEEQKKLVEKARRGSEDEIDIIKKVRTLRKVGGSEKIGKVSVEPFIENAISKVESQASGRGIDIECDNCECKVQGGPLFEELFSNLVENSITHSGCEKIRISSEETEDGCVVKIEDDGHGIPEEEKDKIFEKGFTTAEKRGTGLGLYLVKEIAESYGGSINVKDSELGGARFDLHLQKV